MDCVALPQTNGTYMYLMRTTPHHSVTACPGCMHSHRVAMQMYAFLSLDRIGPRVHLVHIQSLLRARPCQSVNHDGTTYHSKPQQRTLSAYRAKLK